MSDAYNSPSRNGNLSAGTAAKPAKAADIADQARAVGRDVKQQASQLADSATETVKAKASEFTDSAKEFVSDAGEKLKATMQDQKVAGAEYVGTVANIVRRAANEFEGEIPQAAHYIRKAATQIDGVSQALRNRDLSELLGNAQDFARRQPTAFFGAAVLVGFAAIRFFKSSSAQTSSTQRAGTSGMPVNGAGRSGASNTMAQGGGARSASYSGGMAKDR